MQEKANKIHLTMSPDSEPLSILKKSVNLFINLAYKAEDGKYHLPITMSPEYKPAEDYNYDLSSFRWGLQTLISTSERLKIDDSLIATWKEIKKNLLDYQ